MHFLNLKSSTGYDVAVPVRLPDAITFPCFIPGVGLATACLHPTSLDPAEAEVGELEVWRTNDPERRCLRLEGLQDDAAVEQAGDVLDCIVDRLQVDLQKALTMTPVPAHAQVLQSIADLAHHEACAREAWESLPGNIRTGSPLVPRTQTPYAADALYTYVQLLVNEAFDVALKAADERQDDWYREQAEERAEARRASHSDAAVDRYKDGQP